MDYEKKYKEALELARDYYKANLKLNNADENLLLEDIFPELRGDEDEKIRKALVRFHKSTIDIDGIKGADILAWLEKQGKPQDKGEISDGYHTFNELYYYRMLYNAAFFNMLPKEWVHKSKRHNDGEECFGGGWFIVMANLPTGQISNHYELKDWDLFQIPEKEVADKWDGHTPQEAADRLHKYLLEKQGEQKPIMNVPTREVILSIWDLGNEWKELTNGSISTEYGTQLDYIQKHWYESEYYLREKQGEQKPVLDFKASNWYVSKVDGKIHDLTYNPTDKVEPKFKIGDVLCDKSCTTLNKNSQPNIEILDIRDGMYICNNCSIPISQQDEYELVTKKIEPQSAWSDEDEEMAEDLIKGLLSSEKVYNLAHTSKEIADWLKSLKDRIGG